MTKENVAGKYARRLKKAISEEQPHHDSDKVEIEYLGKIAEVTIVSNHDKHNHTLKISPQESIYTLFLAAKKQATSWTLTYPHEYVTAKEQKFTCAQGPIGYPVVLPMTAEEEEKNRRRLKAIITKVNRIIDEMADQSRSPPPRAIPRYVAHVLSGILEATRVDEAVDAVEGATLYDEVIHDPRMRPLGVSPSAKRRPALSGKSIGN